MPFFASSYQGFLDERFSNANNNLIYLHTSVQEQVYPAIHSLLRNSAQSNRGVNPLYIDFLEDTQTVAKEKLTNPIHSSNNLLPETVHFF